MIIYIINLFKRYFNILYSIYKSKILYSVGKDFIISYPIHIYNGSKIRIGNGFRAEKRVRLEVLGNGKINIGDNVQINWNSHIGALNNISIEDNVLIGSNVLITDHSHGKNISLDELAIPPSRRNLYSKGKVIIKRNVWIGENVSVLPNVEVGENSIIGANSVVTKSIDSNCIVAGNPAKVIKRF